MFLAPLPRRRTQPLPHDGAAGTAPGSAYRWETAAGAQAAKAVGTPSKPTKVLSFYQRVSLHAHSPCDPTSVTMVATVLHHLKPHQMALATPAVLQTTRTDRTHPRLRCDLMSLYLSS